MRDNNQGKVNVVAIIIVVIILVSGIVCVAYFSTMVFSAFKEMEEEMSVNLDEFDTKVDATIVSFRESESSMGKGVETHTAIVYSPIYEYEYNGETYTATTDVSTTEKKYEVGDVTSVRISSTEPDKMYDPNFNAKSEFDEFKKEARKMFVLPTLVSIMILFGVVALVIISVVKARSSAAVISVETKENMDALNEFNPTVTDDYNDYNNEG